jgi:hypothetical protein
MQLAAWQREPTIFQPIRDLTSDEIRKSEEFREPIYEAENRLSLFHILNLNYMEWSNFINSLLTTAPEPSNTRHRLNQLMLNVLTVSYAITEHFEHTYRHKFKKNPAKLKEFYTFIEKLRTKSWAFAFFQDFRNYVQHCHLPIHHYRRFTSKTKIEISITQSAPSLLTHYRDWKLSELRESHGTLDLVTLLQDYYMHLSHSFGSFVIKHFYPNLVEADAFFAQLTAEVHAKYPGCRMVFGTISKENKKDGKVGFDINFKQVPNFLFSELGLKQSS